VGAWDRLKVRVRTILTSAVEARVAACDRLRDNQVDDSCETRTSSCIMLLDDVCLAIDRREHRAALNHHLAAPLAIRGRARACVHQQPQEAVQALLHV
jgi:hypothetical protein